MGYEPVDKLQNFLPEYANNDITHNVEFTLHGGG